jgi:hypothetical protein
MQFLPTFVMIFSISKKLIPPPSGRVKRVVDIGLPLLLLTVPLLLTLDSCHSQSVINFEGKIARIIKAQKMLWRNSGYTEIGSCDPFSYPFTLLHSVQLMWQTSGDKDCQDILIDFSILPNAELYDAVVQSYTITSDPPLSTYHDQVMINVVSKYNFTW